MDRKMDTEKLASWGLAVRISKARRQEDGKVETLGVERQEPPTKELIEGLGGYVAKTYVRNDMSAFNAREFPFNDALEDLRSGVIVGLAAWQFDRITRRVGHAQNLLAAIRDTPGAQIALVKGGSIDLTSAAGRLNFNVLTSIAEFGSDITSERVLLKLEQNAQAGKPHGGMRPYGFQSNRIDHDPDEADLLRAAAKAILVDKKTTSAVVRAWRGCGSTRARSSVTPPGNRSSRTATPGRRCAATTRSIPSMPDGDQDEAGAADARRSTWGRGWSGVASAP
jgi:site-specific DNA recombinase